MVKIIRKKGGPGGQQHESAGRKSESAQKLILKQAQIRDDKKRIIGGSPSETGSEAQAKLIYDGDQAIGVRVVCTCGKATEIFFEYGE